MPKDLKQTDSASADCAPARGYASFRKLFADVKKYQRERLRNAGKHTCVAQECGTMRQLERDGKILKRPIVLMRYYECKICGRDMTHNSD